MRHVSIWEHTDYGWITVSCDCGWSVGPVPSGEDAGDAWGDHQYAVGYADGAAGAPAQAPAVVVVDLEGG